eukprot:3932273-Rhodomonas_salina.2
MHDTCSGCSRRSSSSSTHSNTTGTGTLSSLVSEEIGKHGVSKQKDAEDFQSQNSHNVSDCTSLELHNHGPCFPAVPDTEMESEVITQIVKTVAPLAPIVHAVSKSGILPDLPQMHGRAEKHAEHSRQYAEEQLAFAKLAQKEQVSMAKDALQYDLDGRLGGAIDFAIEKARNETKNSLGNSAATTTTTELDP